MAAAAMAPSGHRAVLRHTCILPLALRRGQPSVALFGPSSAAGARGFQFGGGAKVVKLGGGGYLDRRKVRWGQGAWCISGADNSAASGKKTMRKLGFASLILGCFSVAAPGADADDYWPRVGELHPDFVLPDVGDGRAVTLSHLRGKKVLLIHFASW